MTPLFQIGPFQLTPYGLCILAGALSGVLLCLRRKEILPALLPVILGAVISGHFVWALFCPPIYADEKLSLLLQFQKGGYTLYGALLGGTLGAMIGAHMLKTRPLAVLDALTPGACAAIFFGRIGEYFNGQGFGETLEGDHFFFPISYCSYSFGDYQEWSYAVWAWEAIAALILLILLLRCFRNAPEGRLFAVFTTYIGTTQILLEQMRRDSFVSLNPVVRFTQIAAALTLAALLIYLILRYRPSSVQTGLSFAAFAAAIAAAVMAEFVFDKTHLAWIMYLALAAAAALVYALLRTVRKENGRMAGGMYALICGMLLVMHYLNGRNDSSLILYGVMAAAVCGVAVSIAVNLPAGRKSS